MRGMRDKWFGLLVPLPLFLQMRGAFGLYSEPEELPIGLGVPIGFLAALFLLLPDVPKMAQPLPLGRLPYWAMTTFCLWVLFLGILGAQLDSVALLYAAQWVAPVLLMVYLGLVVQSSQRLNHLLIGIRAGTGIALLYLGILFFIEIVTVGSFADRITQNAFLPGMYQLYNYVPVSLTLAGLFCAGLVAGNQGDEKPWKVWAFLFGAAIVPLMTGARDPALIFLLAAPFPAWWAYGARGLLGLVLGSAVLSFGFLLLADGNLLLFHKLHGTFSSYGATTLSGMFGARAEVMESYWGLAERHPWTGLRLLPPSIADPESGVVAKSAHNTYLDILARSGPIGLLAFLGMILPAGQAALKLLLQSFIPSKRLGKVPNRLHLAARAAAAPAIGLLLISCNLRTPLREPISAMVGFLLIGLLLCWAYSEKRGSASMDPIRGRT